MIQRAGKGWGLPNSLNDPDWDSLCVLKSFIFLISFKQLTFNLLPRELINIFARKKKVLLFKPKRSGTLNIYVFKEIESL